MTTPKDIFDEMGNKLASDPSATEGLNAVYQFVVTGDTGGSWYADSTGDAALVAEGTHDSPNVTITVSAEDFVAIKTGELNGQMAFMQGKLKIAGDMGLAMKLQKLLG